MDVAVGSDAGASWVAPLAGNVNLDPVRPVGAPAACPLSIGGVTDGGGSGMPLAVPIGRAGFIGAAAGGVSENVGLVVGPVTTSEAVFSAGEGLSAGDDAVRA